MAKGDSNDNLKLWVVLMKAHSAVAEHARAHVVSRGLTLQEFGIMEALYNKGDLFLGDLQEKILVTSGGVTYLVDRLVEKGMVERRECKEDRRARYASLTDKGRILMEEIFPEHTAWLENAVGGVSEKQKQRAIKILRKLGRHAAATKPGAIEAAVETT